MQLAQVTETAPIADRELCSDAPRSGTADAPPAVAEKFVVISFLIGVALFGLILVVDLVTSLFR